MCAAITETTPRPAKEHRFIGGGRVVDPDGLKTDLVMVVVVMVVVVMVEVAVVVVVAALVVVLLVVAAVVLTTAQEKHSPPKSGFLGVLVGAEIRALLSLLPFRLATDGKEVDTSSLPVMVAAVMVVAVMAGVAVLMAVIVTAVAVLARAMAIELESYDNFPLSRVALVLTLNAVNTPR